MGVRPPFGGHVLQRASVDDGLKPHVSAQRGSTKHFKIIISPKGAMQEEEFTAAAACRGEPSAALPKTVCQFGLVPEATKTRGDYGHLVI